MYELIILSLLMRFPLHGYLIAQIANDVIGPWAKISNGTLYPLLTKLEQTGLIIPANEEQEASDRPARRFMITEEGRKRFHQLMMDTSSNIGDYQKVFHLKVPYLDLLKSSECEHLLNHYNRYCHACILHMETHAANLVNELVGSYGVNPHHRELALQLMQHRAQQWQAEVNWTAQLREKLVPQIEN